MCRSKAEGGRRCGCAYNMRLNLGEVRAVLDQAQKYRGNPDPANARRQPIRRLANYQRKLQAEAYNIDHALDALTADIVGRDLIEGTVVVTGPDGQNMEVGIRRPAPRFDGTGIEDRLSEEKIKRVSSQRLSMSQLREQYPDVYDSIHTVNGRDSHDYLPEAFEEGEFERRHSRYKNNYTRSVGKDPDTILHDVVTLTARAKETRQLRAEVKETLADSLPVGTVLAPWKQKGEFSSSGVKIVDTFDSVTPAKVRSWAKERDNGAQVLSDITAIAVDSAKVKRHFPEVYESLRRPGAAKLDVKAVGATPDGK